MKKILADPRIESVSDERGNGDGIWFYLKKGFINGEREVHCIHEQTLKQCASQLSWIRPCSCNQCIN